MQYTHINIIYIYINIICIVCIICIIYFYILYILVRSLVISSEPIAYKLLVHHDLGPTTRSFFLPSYPRGTNPVSAHQSQTDSFVSKEHKYNR